MEEDQPEDRSLVDHDAPNFWIEAFRGTPMSIVVPPYIRFLQGTVVLYSALNFLRIAQRSAMRDAGPLAKSFSDLESTKDSRQLGVTFETFFASQLSVNLVSEVEHFLGSAIAAALRLYPEKMGSQTFKLADIISSSSKTELIERASGAVLNSLLYEKPTEYLKRLADILSIDSTGIDAHWPAFIELKARRDLGVHNNWVVNEIYLRKLREANIPTTSAWRPANSEL